MKVWQPATHISARAGGDKVDDWSWRATRRRLATLVQLAAPYKLRAALAIGSLLAATLLALVPFYLTKLVIDQGIGQHDLHRLNLIVIAFLVNGVLLLAASAGQSYFTGWVGERILADLRTKLFRHLQKLSLGYYERTRAGVIISRL
ncbi:MAG: ABC transporter transmembrane domain-containing protein, partial [Gaiellaceae bacterium]